MPKSGLNCGGNEFPPLNYSRSYFTQWLLKDTEECSTPSTYTNQKNVKRNNMELIQLLAINALEFTAPVYSFLNKDCNKPSSSSSSSTATTSTNQVTKSTAELTKELKQRQFIQLSGHPGTFGTAGPNSIWKKMPNDSQNESLVYERLRDSEDGLKKLIPDYISRTEWNGSIFIELEDLVTHFDVDNLNIMDMKLGVRTFLESEVTNVNPRKDLYEKMLKLDPSSLTLEEHEIKSVTKLRYMQFREDLSSTKELGFRIEGLQTSNKNVTFNLKKIRHEHEIKDILKSFLGNLNVTNKLLDLRNILDNSNFIQKHEIIGSSLLLIHDHVKFGAWIIDFAKTFQINNINHRTPWSMGNREDGFLIGIDNIIRIIQNI